MKWLKIYTIQDTVKRRLIAITDLSSNEKPYYAKDEGKIELAPFQDTDAAINIIFAIAYQFYLI